MPYSRTDLKNRIHEYIIQDLVLGDANFKLANDESLMEKQVVDSFGVLELVLFVEEEFKFNVPDRDVIPENFDTVNNLVSYIYSKIGS